MDGNRKHRIFEGSTVVRFTGCFKLR